MDAGACAGGCLERGGRRCRLGPARQGRRHRIDQGRLCAHRRATEAGGRIHGQGRRRDCRGPVQAAGRCAGRESDERRAGLCGRRAPRSGRYRHAHCACAQGHGQFHGGGRVAVHRFVAGKLDRGCAGPSQQCHRGTGAPRPRGRKAYAPAAPDQPAQSEARARAGRRAADLHALCFRIARGRAGDGRPRRRGADADLRGEFEIRPGRRQVDHAGGGQGHRIVRRQGFGHGQICLRGQGRYPYLSRGPQLYRRYRRRRRQG